MSCEDIPSVSRIEKNSFDYWLTTKEIRACFFDSRVVSFIASMDNENCGFLMLDKQDGLILDVAVAAEHRRKGIGRRLVAETFRRKGPIWVGVRETNLTAQLFFKNLGFRCIRILKDSYEFSSEDEYLFVKE
jgi:ribosomal-protein-alanine N-acetyltransferase